MTQQSFSTESTAASMAHNLSPSRVGEMLRRAREEKGLSIAEIANALCIRSTHLQALEQGSYAELPALVYARGFVRSYAEYLKLDPTVVLEQFRLETANQEQAKDAVYIPANSNKHMPGKPVIVGSLVAFLLIVLIWNAVSSPSVEPETPAETETGVIAESAGDDAGLATVTTPPSGEEQNIYSPSETANESAAKPAPVANPATPAPAPAVATVPAAIPPVAQAEAPVEEAPVAAERKEAPVANNVLVFEAISDAWVEVRDENEKVIFTKVMRAGESYALPNQHLGGEISAGNGGGIAARINGRRIGVIGKPGEVVSGVKLDPHYIASIARDLPR